MGQVLHGSATTTEAIRRARQHSQESLRALAKRYGVNQKTVAKWRNRNGVGDLTTGPKEPKSTVLTVEEEAIIDAFRRHMLLPLDDCLYSLQVEPLSAIGSRIMARDPASEPLVAAPLPSAPWHLAPVTVWCRSFHSILCSKGAARWDQHGRTNFARMQCG